MKIQSNPAVQCQPAAESQKTIAKSTTLDNQQAIAPALTDILLLKNSKTTLMKHGLSVMGGVSAGVITGAGIAGLTARGPQLANMGGLLMNGAKVSLAAGAAAAGSAALFTDNPKSGAAVGAVVGGLVSALEWGGKDPVRLTVAGTIGLVVGGVSGYTASKIKAQF